MNISKKWTFIGKIALINFAGYENHKYYTFSYQISKSKQTYKVLKRRNNDIYTSRKTQKWEILGKCRTNIELNTFRN